MTSSTAGETRSPSNAGQAKGELRRATPWRPAPRATPAEGPHALYVGHTLTTDAHALYDEHTLTTDAHALYDEHTLTTAADALYAEQTDADALYVKHTLTTDAHTTSTYDEHIPR